MRTQPSHTESGQDISEIQEERNRLLERALKEPGVAEVMNFWRRIKKTLPEHPPVAAPPVTRYATDANPKR